MAYTIAGIDSTVAKVLKTNGIPPAPDRPSS
jgi:hypothetical protein